MRYPCDLIGKRYGSLIVLRRIPKQELPSKYQHRGQRYWWLRCVCGNTVILSSNRFLSMGQTSCGNACPKKQHWSKSPGEAAKWAYFVLQRKLADRRRITWSLTLEQFLKITGSPCKYCGREWSKLFPNRKDKGRTNGNYQCNGIDRLDSSIGYVADNCAPCCADCNMAKGAMTIDEFKSWVMRAYRHMKIGPEVIGKDDMIQINGKTIRP